MSSLPAFTRSRLRYELEQGAGIFRSHHWRILPFLSEIDEEPVTAVDVLIKCRSALPLERLAAACHMLPQGWRGYRRGRDVVRDRAPGRCSLEYVWNDITLRVALENGG